MLTFENQFFELFKLHLEMSKVFGFVTTKGGAGKSTLTRLIAGYLQYVKGADVLVIDGDPQGTISKKRTSDLELYDGEELKSLEESAYTLEAYAPVDITQQVNLNREFYEYIILDLAGSAAVPGNIRAYANLDRMIIPTNGLDDVNMEVFTTVSIIMNQIMPARKQLGLGAIKMCGMLNGINPGVGDVKAMKGMRTLDNQVIKDDIKALREDPKALTDYTLPVQLLGETADINKAEAALGSYLTTLKEEQTLGVLEKYRIQCESILSFVNS